MPNPGELDVVGDDPFHQLGHSVLHRCVGDARAEDVVNELDEELAPPVQLLIVVEDFEGGEVLVTELVVVGFELAHAL